MTLHVLEIDEVNCLKNMYEALLSNSGIKVVVCVIDFHELS